MTTLMDARLAHCRRLFLRGHEVLAWRQDWGSLSPHPMSPTGQRTVREKLPVAA